MGDVLIKKGALSEGRITSLDVEMHGLPARTIDRDTAIAWMKDGHSFVPYTKGQRGPALLLIEVGEELFIRNDPNAEASDTLPSLG